MLLGTAGTARPLEGIGDAHPAVDMLADDLPRITEYPRLGFAIEQDMRSAVAQAYGRLVDRGLTGRLTA